MALGIPILKHFRVNEFNYGYFELLSSVEVTISARYLV